MPASFEDKVEAILAEMHADPKPNYTYYTLRLQTLPQVCDGYVAACGTCSPSYDNILRRALGDVCNHMAKAYGLGAYKKSAGTTTSAPQ